MHLPSPVNEDPHYYKRLNNQGIAEAYLRDIHRKVHEKKFSFLATFTGKHRVGKSIGAVAFGDLLDPTFMPNLEERVVYTPHGFSSAIQNLYDNRIFGGVVVWDEANLGLSSRDWYTQANKHINFTVQAFGFMRPIVFFVTQDVTFIDSQPRKLFHAFMEVDRTNTQYNSIRPFQVNINKRTGKMFFPSPRLGIGRHGKGRIIKIKILRMKKPPKELIKRYEDFSIKEKANLMKENDDIIRHMRDKTQDDKRRDRLTDEEILDHVIAERNNPVFTNRKGEFEANTIAQEFKVTFRKAQYLKLRADARLHSLKNEGVVEGADNNKSD